MLQAHEKHFLFTFEYETLHRNIDRVTTVVETHQAFLLSCGDRFLLEFTPCLLLVQSYPGTADGQIGLTGFSQKITQKMLRLVALARRMVRVIANACPQAASASFANVSVSVCPTI